MRIIPCFIVLLLSFNVLLKAQTDSITVYYFLAEECVICQQYTPKMNALYSAYNSDKISFVGLFPNRFSKEESIAAFQEKYKIPFLLKREYFQTKTKMLGAKITPEVVVYNETRGEILYKGRIDNMYVRVGKRRRIVTKNELENVLEGISSGKKIEINNTPSIGCYINLLKLSSQEN